MESKSDLNAEFSNAFYRKLENQSSPSWLAKLKMLEGKKGKITFGGIPHKAYWFDLKRNHFSIIVDVLNEVCPHLGPFNKKTIIFQENEESEESKPPQSENPSVTFKLKAASENSLSMEQKQKGVHHKVKSDGSSSFFKGMLTSGEESPFEVKSDEPDFEFKLESFIAGERNLLAARACRAVTEMPGSAFNPFVIYGVSGSGKTHLLQGIGRELKTRHPELNVVYLTAEQFLNDFIHSIRGQKMNDFREKYRNADLFLLDDLDLIASGKQVQQELLNTLNHLRQKKKQIVITSRDAPSRISQLTDGLCNRLESGLVIDVGVPDMNSRIKILVNKAQEKGIPLSNDLAEFMAKHITGSVSRLEGALTRLGVHTTLLNEPLSIELAGMNLRDLLGKHAESMEQQRPLTGSRDLLKERILMRVCSHFQVTEKDICSKRRDQGVLKARQATIYLFREITMMSLSEMGRFFGRTHSTIHSSLKKVYQRMKSDEFFRRQLYQLRDELKENEVLPSQRDLQVNRGS